MLLFLQKGMIAIMIQKWKYRWDMVQKLQIYAIGVRKWFFVNFVMTVIGMILALILPWFYQMFIEDVILGQKLSYMVLVAAGYLIIQLLATGIAFVRNFCQYTINNQVVVVMRSKILENALKRSFREYDKINVGEYKMVMDEAMVKMCDFTNAQTSEYVIHCGTMLILLVLLFFMEWHLSLILLPAIFITFWLNHINGEGEKKNGEYGWENDQAWGGWIYSSISGWREVKALNLEKECEKKFLFYAEEYIKYFRIFIEHWVTRVFIIPKLKDEFLMQFLLYFLGGILIFRGDLTIGGLLVFAKYYSMIVETIQKIVVCDTDLQVNTVYYRHVLDYLESESKPEKIWKMPQPENVSGDIELRHVSFQYEEEEAQVLHDFSMKISQGERVGIVGESGKGKSTILKLLAGMLEPTEGVVLFGGRPLEELSLQAVHQQIGFVLQDNFLFNTTIRENLWYGKEQATEDEMRQACKKACIDDFICSLPDGYDTVIGEKGIKLSGGQKQRLVLARLFLKDVKFYIFDEATSALDQRAETIIQQSIQNIGRDKTIIIVSHRESSLRLCDRLVYL